MSSRTLSVNGQLKVSGGVVIAPSTQPTTAVSGQIYYDQATNILSYYNGTQFIGLPGNGQVVQSLGGASGAITLGAGLTLNAGQLRANGIVSFTSASNTLTVTNDGNGNVTLSDNRQTSVSGVQTNGGTIGHIAYFDGASSIADSLLSQTTTNVDVAGTLSVADTFSLQSAATATINLTSNTTGVTGQIYNDGNLHITGGQNNLWLDAGGTGTIFLNSSNGNKVAIAESSIPAYPLEVNGDINITASHAYRIDGTVICTISGCLSSSATASLQTAYDNSIGSTTPEIKLSTAKGSVDIQDADSTIGSNLFNIRSSNAGGFGQILFGVGNTGAISAQNAVNSTAAFVVENAAGVAQLTVDTTNSKVIIGALQTNSLTPTAALTVGSSSQSFTVQGNASSTLTATNGANTTSLVFQTPTASVTYRFLTAAAGTYDICTSVGNCAGAGSGVTTPGGTAGTIARFTAGQTIGDSIITDNGTTVTIGGALSVNTVTPTSALTVGATGQNLTLQGATVQLTSTNAGVTNSLVFATPASGNKTITIPNVTGTVCLDSGNCLGGGGGGANTSLSNLTSVAINTSLLPGTAGGISLGSGTLPFADMYLAGSSGTPATNNFRLTGTSTGGTRTITLPDASGTVCLQASASCGFIQNTTTLQTNANVAIQSAADSDITMRIRERSTQSVDVFRIEDSNGNYQLTVDAFGGLHVANKGTFDSQVGIGLGASSNEQLRVAPVDAGTSGITIYGNSGQTADLLAVNLNGSATPGFSVGGAGQTKVQNSADSTAEFTVNNAAGKNLLRIDSTNSALIVGNLTSTVGAGVAGLIKLADGTNDTFAASLQLAGALTGNVNFQLPNSLTGNQTLCVASNNCNFATATGGSGYIQNGTSVQTANYAIQSASAGSIAALVKGASGQTASILEVQNSGGAALFSISGNTNYATFNDNLTVNGQGPASDTALTVKTNSSANANTLIADFQKNDGTSLARITNGAGLYLGNVSGVAGSVNISNAGGHFAAINSTPLTNDRTISLPDASGTVCLTSGNCGTTTGTLQAAYGYSTGGSTPEIKLDVTRQGVDVQDADSTLGSNANFMSYRASNSLGLGAVVFGWGIQGNYFQKPTSDSTTVFQVENATGGNVFTVDSTNGRVGINLGGSSNPAYTLEVKGDLNVGTGVYRSGGTAGLTATTCSGGQVMQNIVVAGGIVTGGTCTANASTLQQAYDASTSPQIVLSSAGGALTVRDNATPLSGNLFAVQNNASVNSFSVSATAVTAGRPLTVQSVTDGVTFTVRSSLNNNAFTVDTTNSRVGIGLGGSNLPSLTNQGLEILGALRLSGTAPTNMDTYTTPAGASVNTKINIPNQDPGAFGQLIAMGLPSTANVSARVLSLLDARTTAHQPTIGVFSPNENDLVGFSWEGASTTAYLKTTGGNIALRSNATDLMTLLAGGNVGIGATPSYKLDVAGDINTSTQYRIGGNVICTASGCTVAAGSGSYIQNTVTTQSANMAIQASDTTAPTASFEQGASGTADVIDVLKNDGTTKYLSVSSGGNFTVANGSSYSLSSNTSGSLTSNGSITVTAGGASTWSTSSGNLTIQAAGTSTLALQTGGAGTVSLGNQNSTTINIGAGSNIARTIHIGDAGTSQAQTVTLGSNGGTSTTTIQGGTNSTAVNITTGSGGYINLITSGSGNINLIAGGTITDKVTTDSTTAYQVQNASGAALVSVDSVNSNISLLGNNSPTLTTWATTTAMTVGSPNTRVRGGAVAANGYLYHLGGVDGNGATVATVEYSKINADGTVGTWASTTSLPNTIRQFQPVVSNGYIYVIGGRDNSNATLATSYYAKINNDGTLGTWNTTTALSSGAQARFGQGTIAYNGYIYVLGGFNSSVSAQGSVLYAKVNSDGTLASSWSTTTSFSTGLANINGATVANGYAYVVGGWDGSTDTDYVRRAKINNDGTMSSWTNQTGVVPGGGDENFQTFVSNGYLYVVGGDNGSHTSVFQLNADGSVGAAASLTAFPVNMGEAAAASANGYFYILGGSAGSDGSSTVRNTVYYASTSRVKVGGNLDLVSYGGENLSEGGTGGQLTAGNTAIVGTMQVQGDATFARNLTIGGTLTVNNGGNIQGSSAGGDILDLKNSSGTNVLSVSSIGAAQLQNSFDSVAAFTVKNAAGTSTLINADTTNGRVGIGGVASFSKFEVQGGDAAIYNNGGNPRLIIGNSTSAGQNGFLQYDSSNNYLRLETTGTNGLKVNDNYVTIGNIFPNQPLTVANGTTQLFQVTTTGTVSAKTTTNSTAGFQVQNAGGTEQFTVDTSNSRVYVGPTAGDTTGTILVLGNKTNAGDPTGVAGAMYYNANGGKFRCYENGAWKNCLGFNANLSLFGGDGNGAAAQWTNMAAALTEIFTPSDVSVPSSRILYDLTDAQQVRFQINVATVGAASAELRIQYSTDQSTWNYLDSGNTGLGQNISTTGFKTSSWANIASGAKGDVYLRVVGINGDGALDPRFGLIQVQAR